LSRFKIPLAAAVLLILVTFVRCPCGVKYHYDKLAKLALMPQKA